MVELDKVSELLSKVATDIILPRHRKLGEGDISEKDHGELVTIADTETEKWLSLELANLLPGSSVVGEEAAYADPRVFERLTDEIPVWVIDPVDGTHNFTKGSDIFAVIVALVIGGETVAGWIYEPIGQTLACGERGAGVTLGAFGVELGNPQDDPHCHGVAAKQLFERAERDASYIDRVYRPNCAGHEYIQILRGERCFTAYTKLMPWDHAAGSFMIREAGGYSALLDCSPYDVAQPVGNLMSASDEATWWRVQTILAGDEEGKQDDG
ncbi:MAG: inositol monophosphatase [Alphaproteobacteria bacterium]|nr:inositol monophosphatase [Alphaproteobacteria bacterium]